MSFVFFFSFFFLYNNYKSMRKLRSVEKSVNIYWRVKNEQVYSQISEAVTSLCSKNVPPLCWAHSSHFHARLPHGKVCPSAYDYSLAPARLTHQPQILPRLTYDQHTTDRLSTTSAQPTECRFRFFFTFSFPFILSLAPCYHLAQTTFPTCIARGRGVSRSNTKRSKPSIFDGYSLKFTVPLEQLLSPPPQSFRCLQSTNG